MVIIIDYDDGRMFPLTEEIPKCLLPVANRPLLGFQLDMLAKSGAEEVFISAPAEYETQLNACIDDYRRDHTENEVISSMSIELVYVEEMMGSADGLRAVRERIRGDFIVLASDVITQFPLGDLTNLHKLSTSDLSLMLTKVSTLHNPMRYFSS